MKYITLVLLLQLMHEQNPCWWCIWASLSVGCHHQVCKKVHHGVWVHCSSKHMLNLPWSRVSAMRVSLSCRQFGLQPLCATISYEDWAHWPPVTFQLLWTAARQDICPFAACQLLSIHKQQLSTSVGAVRQTCFAYCRWWGWAVRMCQLHMHLNWRQQPLYNQRRLRLQCSAWLLVHLYWHKRPNKR